MFFCIESSLVILIKKVYRLMLYNTQSLLSRFITSMKSMELLVDVDNGHIVHFILNVLKIKLMRESHSVSVSFINRSGKKASGTLENIRLLFEIVFFFFCATFYDCHVRLLVYTLKCIRPIKFRLTLRIVWQIVILAG